jgi:hypothetical protein
MADIVLSPYSRHIDDLLNIHNSIVKYDEISDTINSLYSDVMSNKIRLINQTDTTTDYYKLQERIPIRLINKLLVKSNETNSYIGFNKVSIASTISEPEIMLERIEDYYTYILSNLKNIRKDVSKDLYTYQRLNRLYFNFSNDDLNYLSDKNLFKYFNFTDYYEGERDDEKSLIVTLFLFLFLQPIYIPTMAKIAGDFKFKCFTTSSQEDINITDDELNLTPDNVYYGFSSYMDTNNERISLEISSFLASNIFILNEPSDEFLNELGLVLNSFVDTIKTTFLENVAISNSYQQTIAIKSITSLAEYIIVNDIKDRKDYIMISNENDILNDENYIFQKFNNILNVSQGINLASLTYIVYQFNEFPLYFLNSYFISYNNYLNDILQDTDFMESLTEFMAPDETDDSEHVPNVHDWISRINIDPTEFVANRDSIDIFSEFSNSKALEYNFTLFFTKVISDFIDSDEFHKLIVIDLSEEIKEVANYIVEYRDLIINNIGRIKLFIKIFLIKEMLDGNLFNELFSEFQTAFNAVDVSYPNVNIVNLTSSLKSPTTGVKKIYLEFIKGMLYSGHTSSILNNILDEYRL